MNQHNNFIPMDSSFPVLGTRAFRPADVKIVNEMVKQYFPQTVPYTKEFLAKICEKNPSLLRVIECSSPVSDCPHTSKMASSFACAYYLCLPLKRSMYNALKNGKITEDDLQIDDILSANNDDAEYLLISDLVRCSGCPVYNELGRRVTISLKKNLMHVIRNNKQIKEVGAIISNRKVEGLAEKYGFTQVEGYKHKKAWYWTFWYIKRENALSRFGDYPSFAVLHLSDIHFGAGIIKKDIFEDAGLEADTILNVLSKNGWVKSISPASEYVLMCDIGKIKSKLTRVFSYRKASKVFLAIKRYLRNKPRSLSKLWLTQLLGDWSKNFNRIPIDALIISGDISNTAAASEFAIAADFVNNVAKKFSISKNNIIAVPGNHDVAMCRSQSHKLENFRKFYKKVTGKNYPRDCGEQAILYVNQSKRFVVLGMNSACRVYRKSAQIKAVTDAEINMKAFAKGIDSVFERYPGYRKFVVWHHAISDFKDTSFLGQLEENGFSLILHGHQHKKLDICDMHGKIKICPGGTFGAPINGLCFAYPWQYNLIKVIEKGGVIHVRRKREMLGVWAEDHNNKFSIK